MSIFEQDPLFWRNRADDEGVADDILRQVFGGEPVYAEEREIEQIELDDLISDHIWEVGKLTMNYPDYPPPTSDTTGESNQ